MDNPPQNKPGKAEFCVIITKCFKNNAFTQAVIQTCIGLTEVYERVYYGAGARWYDWMKLSS